MNYSVPLRRPTERGFTLLEVILALAILAGATAVIGELVRTGLRNAQDAGDLTRAELIAQSVMAQIVSGEIAPSSAGAMPVDGWPGWSYSIVLGDSTTTQENLMLVRVEVTRDMATSVRPTGYTLTRWIIDPNFLTQVAQQQADAAAAAQTASSATSSSSSAPSSSTGGAP